MSETEYVLQSDDGGESEVKQLSEEALQSFSDIEREILLEMEGISTKCVENNIPCFLCAKFESQEQTSAAWNFGKDVSECFNNFFKHFAALFLHVTSKMTSTNITAVNPSTNALVYEVKAEVKQPETEEPTES